MSKIFLHLAEPKPNSGHQGRGIGQYHALLKAALLASGDIELVAQDDRRCQLQHFPWCDLFFATLPLVTRQPRVVTLHDLIPLDMPDAYPVGPRGQLALWHQTLSLRLTTAVITDSEASARSITQHFPWLQAKTAVVRLAANPELHTPTLTKQAAVRHQYGLPEQFVLYVGDINPNKNLPTLIQAIAQLADVRLVCVGRAFRPAAIPEWQILEKTLKINHLSDKVVFLNQIDSTETLSAIYALASVVVLPSVAEGFGLTLLEAMQVGNVVVASQIPVLEEICSTANILVPPTVLGLAHGLQQALKLNPEARTTIIRQGQLHAAKFTWEKTAAQTIGSYRAALNS